MSSFTSTRFLIAGLSAVFLAGCSADDSAQAATDVSPLSAGYALARAGELALSAASAAGLNIVSMPSTGCSNSLLAPERVMELLAILPDAQRAALVTVLDASAGVWTTQLYKGSLGVGICIPTQQALVLLPAAANTVVDKVSAAIPTGVSN